MKKIFLSLIISLLLLFTSAALTSCRLFGFDKIKLFDDELPYSEPDPDVHIRVKAADEPNIVYAPLYDRAGYRYGPSIIYYADGSCDAWFSCTGSQGEWDWISYRHSDDGINFGDEKVVLTPNPDSMDYYSCCDPGVVYFGGYYYLGYTSTTFNGGVNNHVFVARSRTPDGPFEKWNGSGWGGDPKPIVYYNEDETKYGAGEPSFVVVGDTLYVYYTWTCGHGQFLGVAIADTSENWPLTLQDYGPVFNKKNWDSVDMIFLEDNCKFYGFCTSDRFSDKSGITVIESADGVDFVEMETFKNGLYQFLHNDGIAHRPDGHIQLKDRHFVGYGFSDGANGNWGKWATAFQEVSFELYKGDIEEKDDSEIGEFCTGYFSKAPEDPKPIAVSTGNRIYNFIQYYSGETVPVIWFDSNLNVYGVEDYSNVKFYGYDTSLIRLEGNSLYLTGKVGETYVYLEYEGLRNFFKVRVYPSGDTLPGDYKKDIVSFDPVQDSFAVSKSDTHKYQIRGKVVFSDHTWAEAFNDNIMLDAKAYPVTFEVADSSVIFVSSRGIITPLSAGKTEVKVTIKGEKSFAVTVEVTD